MSRTVDGSARSRVLPLVRTATLLLAMGVLLFGMLLGIGWLLTHVEQGTSVGAADVGVLHWLVAHRVPSLDTASLYAADLASTATVLVSGAVAGVVAAVVLRRGWPLVLLVIALVGELVLFLNAAILVGRPRPAVPHLDAALPPTSSFPSGHTAAAICLYGGVATIVLRVVQAWWRWLVLGVAVLVIVAVAAARLYRGAHYPTDVLGSVLFAVPWLLVTTKACAPSRTRWVCPDQPVGASTSS
jgi:membrane-associated phospholipid phosphatase